MAQYARQAKLTKDGDVVFTLVSGSTPSHGERAVIPIKLPNGKEARLPAPRNIYVAPTDVDAGVGIITLDPMGGTLTMAATVAPATPAKRKGKDKDATAIPGMDAGTAEMFQKFMAFQAMFGK